MRKNNYSSSDWAEHISNHGFEDHVLDSSEFNDTSYGPEQNITNKDEYRAHAESTLNSSDTEFFDGDNNRTFFYNDRTNTAGVLNGNSPEDSTCFRPDQGKEWFEENLSKENDRLDAKGLEPTEIETGSYEELYSEQQSTETQSNPAAETNDQQQTAASDQPKNEDLGEGVDTITQDSAQDAAPVQEQEQGTESAPDQSNPAADTAAQDELGEGVDTIAAENAAPTQEQATETSAAEAQSPSESAETAPQDDLGEGVDSIAEEPPPPPPPQAAEQGM